MPFRILGLRALPIMFVTAAWARRTELMLSLDSCVTLINLGSLPTPLPSN
jgi:hypothetical protein